MNTNRTWYQTVGLCLCVVGLMMVIIGTIAQSNNGGNNPSHRPVDFYGKIVSVESDVTDPLFSDIRLVRYVDCDKDGASKYDDDDQETVLRMYSKPALVSFRFQPRIGDVVLIARFSYKSDPEFTGLEHFNNLNVVLPLDSEPLL